MFDISSKSAPENASDLLSEMLKGLRLDGVAYGRFRMAAPWGIRFPAQASAWFHFVAQSGCWLQAPDGKWMELSAGDAVLLPRGTGHVLASAPDVPVIAVKELQRRTVCENMYDLQGGGAEGNSTMLFCGSMDFNLDSLHPLMHLMPDLMKSCDLAGKEPAFPFLLDAMNREVEMDRVGAAGILARLADVLAASIIRSWVEFGCGDSTGWIAAVRCPSVGKVLAAIHANPDENWNLAALAKVMGASRSSFVEKFASTVGETPARYVARVRMSRARHWISRDKVKLAVVAQSLGYDSEASFSRAFKRVFGQAPSHFRPTGER